MISDRNVPAGAGTVSLADEEAVKAIVVNAVFSLWDVVNELTRLRPRKRDRYSVTIFGSARTKPCSFAYEETKRVSRALAEMGCDIITGGGPGLMQAANEGAKEAGAPERGRSAGIRIDLPFEQAVNPFVEQAFVHKTFFTRLHQFVLMSDAYVVAPGGIGTLLELSMVWQLLQVRHVYDTPLVLVGPMWRSLLDWGREHLMASDPPMVNPEDLDIPKCVDNGDEAIAIIREHHAAWLARERANG
jgi:uncharacterized protein (TIGR00730 family)